MQFFVRNPRADHSPDQPRQSGSIERCAYACADRNCRDHRCRHGSGTRCDPPTAAPLFRSARRGRGGQRQGRQSFALAEALEYITSQNMEKRAFDLLNCITVVPGALGAWRRQAIEAAGGITADTVAEDADLTIAIRRLGWRVSYDEYAVAWTEAPATP